MENFKDFGLKLINSVVLMSSWRFVSSRGQCLSLTFDLNEFMKICEFKRSMSFFDL